MIYLIVFGFIVMDFVTGMLKAFAVNEYSSAKMREGLYHKCGLVLVMVLAALINYAQKYVDMGVTLPVIEFFSGYIVMMETGSTIENLCKINPELMPDKLNSIFSRGN